MLVAAWSFEDAKAHGLTQEYDEYGSPTRQVDWDKLRAMPSARLFVLRQGDVLLMPAGTYHYVYTIRRKLVLAGDFANASGWTTRVESVKEFGADQSHQVSHGPPGATWPPRNRRVTAT